MEHIEHNWTLKTLPRKHYSSCKHYKREMLDVWFPMKSSFCLLCALCREWNRFLLGIGKRKDHVIQSHIPDTICQGRELRCSMGNSVSSNFVTVCATGYNYTSLNFFFKIGVSSFMFSRINMKTTFSTITIFPCLRSQEAYAEPSALQQRLLGSWQEEERCSEEWMHLQVQGKRSQAVLFSLLLPTWNSLIMVFLRLREVGLLWQQVLV